MLYSSCYRLEAVLGRSIFSRIVAYIKMSSSQHARTKSTSSASQPLTHDPRPVTSHIHRISAKAPPDAPPMTIRWFYATDVPKKRLVPDPSEKPKAPNKWTAFTPRDSKALEAAFQKSIENPKDPVPPVPVNEDHLFEVDIAERELRPIYFRGSTYEVRRGGWFFQEGSVLKPCEEVLAAQIEEGYIKLKPFRTQATTTTKVPSQPPSEDKQDPASASPVLKAADSDKPARTSSPFRFPSISRSTAPTTTTPVETAKKEMIWKLLGEQHMGKYVVYTNATTAWLLSDDLYGKLTASVYQTLTAGVHLGGAKLIRGYVEPTKKSAKAQEEKGKDKGEDMEMSELKPSTLIAAAKGDKESMNRVADQAEEKEMEQDYDTSEKEDPTRQIDHLILCVHGIGQKLGERMESVNFVHDINVFRRTLKDTFASADDLGILLGEKKDSSRKPNCRVQVLPVQWRQEIQFGMDKEDNKKKVAERDIGDASDDDMRENSGNATLQDITVEGLAPIRSLISDVLLDILLYYTPQFRERIVRAVAKEMNRIYNLFCERNPTFNGRVSLIGHSLGSVICFDILCRQPLDRNIPVPKEFNLDPRLKLPFDVHGFFAVGSPIGLFQMLKGRNIAPRSVMERKVIVNTPLGEEFKELGDNGDVSVSCPKCDDIFHPYDPIAYRVEPLISKKMAEVKPHPLPYTKGGLREQLVGLSGVGQRISSGASNLWSSVRSSITSSLISRSLGYGDISSENAQPHQQDPQTPGVGLMPEDTLYSVFKQTTSGLRTARQEAEKLRAINSTGRVDFVIQEGLFETSYLSAIAAHLQYWNDEDVAHFMLSQLLLGTQSANIPERGHSAKPSQS